MLELDSAERDRLGRDVVREQDLEHGRVARIAARIERLDEPLEGELLIRVRLERGGAHPVEQLVERDSVLHRRAQRERVGEVADQRQGLLVVAAGDRRAHHDVLRPCVPVQQGVEAGEEDREERDVARSREPAELLREVDRQGAARLGSGVRLRRRTRTVGREVEPVGRAVELSAPIRDELVEHRPAEAFALPGGEVGVADRQLAEVRRVPGERMLVRGCELAEQDRRGSMVGDEMVADEEQAVVIWQPQKRRPQQCVPLEIERGPCDLRDELVHARLVTELVDGELDTSIGIHTRPRRAFDDDDRGSHDVVPRDHGVERRLQCRRVEPSGRAQEPRHVVGRDAREHPLEQPHPLLCEGEDRLLRRRKPRNARRAARPRQDAALDLLPRGRRHSTWSPTAASSASTIA